MAGSEQLPAGQVELQGQVYMPDAQGRLVAVDLVKEQHKLQDQAVRKLFAAAQALSTKIRAFKDKAFDDVDALQALLEQKYKVKTGGAKGNVTLMSYDGLVRIQVQVADQIRFGPELHAAKNLIDECIGEWSKDSRVEIRQIVMNAFPSEKEGQVNRGALLGLLQLEIQDDRWVRAMQAIRDSIRVEGTKRYIRFSFRPKPNEAWENVHLDIATA